MAQTRKSSTLWRRSAIAVAVGLSVVSGASFAQSNATGNIYGQVSVAAGSSILIENTATGVKRTLTPDASGRFVASSLPTGTYKVTLMRDGKVVSVTENVEVTLGQGREVFFADAAATQTVQVVGKVAQIDMSSTTNGATFTAKQLAALPIAHDVNAIIQLAPNTTTADPRYSGGASMGGGAPSENSYYINGFPVTNPLTQLGAAELPFGAIQEAQVLTGGFGAEFGRSIGGVVNIITKSGTNNWEGGVQASVTPEGLTGKRRDIYYPNTGYNSETDGTIYRKRSDNTQDDYSLGAYLGGPLIEDTLFMFVAAERLQSNRGTAGALSADGSGTGTWTKSDNTNDRYLAKFDWNITNDHHLELSLVGDRYYNTEKLSTYDYSTGKHSTDYGSAANYTNVDGTNDGVGAASQILKYTGYLTDDLTATALYGQSKTQHINSFAGVDVNSNIRQVILNAPSAAAPGLTYNNPYPFDYGTQVLAPGSEDTVKSLRLDLEYRMGDHSLRGGLDQVRLKSKGAGVTYAGGGLLRYYSTTNPNLVPTGMTTSVGAGGALTDGTNYYYGREQIFNDVTDAESNQSAQYIEDKWQVTKNLQLIGGLRHEAYENKNGDGQVFLKVKDQIHPRLAFTWDVDGDSSTKIYGSAGRYGVQIPTHLAVRGASRSTFTRQFFTYTGVDANGQPIGRVDLGDPYSSNNEYGQPKDYKTVAAQDLKPNSQDELTLGIEKALSDSLTVGGRVTYRKLVATIDDLCDYRPFTQYAIDHGITDANGNPFEVGVNPAPFGCASFNPGQSNTFLVDYKGDGNYTKVSLSKEQLGFDSAKRTYFAVDLFAEHPYKDGWYGKVTYTWSQSKGNTEGQTLSDVGQTDVAATQTWDFPALMEGAYGYLPGDRRHQIKAFGFYDLTPEWTIGANLLMASGRPKSCLGNYGGTTDGGDYYGYGSSFHYCFEGTTVKDADNNDVKVFDYSPRGSKGNLPWDRRVDLNLTYKPGFLKGLSLRADVFNVFNSQVASAIDEQQMSSQDQVSNTYGRVIAYTAPRSVKFTAAYDVKF